MDLLTKCHYSALSGSPFYNVLLPLNTSYSHLYHLLLPDTHLLVGNVWLPIPVFYPMNTLFQRLKKRCLFLKKVCLANYVRQSTWP